MCVHGCIPISWTYAFMRWFHGPSNAVMAPTNAVVSDLKTWRVGNPVIWPRGVDLDLFTPVRRCQGQDNDEEPGLYQCRAGSGRKNLGAFLDLDLPGEKWVVGGGPALEQLKARYPEVRFFAPRYGRIAGNL